jgi:predicted dehydrogenase
MKFLIAGLGSIGRRHLRNLLALGENDIVLYRTRKASLPDDELAGFPVETDLAAALRRHRPEAVIVANPTALHLEVAVPAAEAGCSILLEKPIAHELEGVEGLGSALKRGGGRLLVGFQFRFHPTLRKAAGLLAGNAIGKPLSFHVHWGEYLPGWHPWEDFKESYAARPELGGGVILTLTHPLDYIRMFLGEVESLWAFTGAPNLGLQVEDSAEIGLRMVKGAIGSVHLDYNQQPPSHRWEIVGSNGTLKWDNASGILEAYSGAKEAWELHAPPEGFERNSMFLEELRHFLAVARGQVEPVCSLEDGIQALRLALAARESAAKNVWIQLDGKNGG